MSSQIITLEVEFITDTHRIIGYLPIGERRLSDILNVDSEDSVVLDSVRTTPVDDPEATPIVREFAQINKETIAFGIPHELPTIPEERRKIRPFEYVEKSRQQVLISLPPFVISGYLHLVKEVDIRSALRSLARTFIPISEARATYTPNPGIKWASKVIIVNRKRTQILWPSKKSYSHSHPVSAGR